MNRRDIELLALTLGLISSILVIREKILISRRNADQ